MTGATGATGSTGGDTQTGDGAEYTTDGTSISTRGAKWQTGGGGGGATTGASTFGSGLAKLKMFGKDGKDGKDGRDGSDGSDGNAGKAGRGGKAGNGFGNGTGTGNGNALNGTATGTGKMIGDFFRFFKMAAALAILATLIAFAALAPAIFNAIVFFATRNGAVRTLSAASLVAFA